MEPRPAPLPRAAAVAAWLAATAVLAVHAACYWHAFADDALISLRYAERLLEGKGLTFTGGRPVEGYSNLLWVLAVAGLGALGVELVLAAKLLGLACSSLVVAAIVRASRTPWALVVGLATWVLAAPVAKWTVAGLEQSLVAATLAWAIVLVAGAIARPALRVRDVWAPGALLGLACLTRPDAPLFVVAIVAVAAAARLPRRQGLAACAWLAAVPAACVGAQLAFRLAYYGEWVPNTALVKVSVSVDHVLHGLWYVARGLALLLPVSALAAWCAVRALRRRAWPTLLAAAPVVLWLPYLVWIGGDIFFASRHLVPAVACFALILAYRDAPWPSRRTRPWVVVGVAVFVVLQWVPRHNRNARYDTIVVMGRAVGTMLRTGFGDARPTIAVDTAGAVPYWSKLPVIDMLGLCDHWIARQRRDDFGSRWIGHEHGDGAYVLERHPDLVLFSDPFGRERADFRSGVEMQRDPRFFERYVLVRFVVPGAPATSSIWISRDSRAVGIRRRDGAVVVPGYLFANFDRLRAHLAEDGRFYARVDAGAEATVDRIALDAGTWRARADEGAVVTVTGDGVTAGGDPETFTVTAPTEVAVTVRGRGGAALRAFEVVLERH